MSTISDTAKAQLRRQGFRVVQTFRGPQGSGKSQRAATASNRLRAEGKSVITEDECEDGAVRVWAK